MRKVLREGTWIRLSQGELYKITGTPVGEGGGSIVYPCKKISHFNGKITVSEIDYALKECFPLSSAFVFERREDGEIVSATENPAAVRYLNSVRKMQMQEQEITEKFTIPRLERFLSLVLPGKLSSLLMRDIPFIW